MTTCKSKKQQVTCALTETPAKAPRCKPFTVCVGNHTLAYDGECLMLTHRKFQIPDGAYSSIEFKDGCIVGVGHVPVPSYTPNPCCDSDGGGGGPAPDVPVSPAACNLTQMSPAGLDTRLFVSPGDGVSVRGCGTEADPLRISMSASGGNPITAAAGDEPIRVEGDGTATSPLIVGMTPRMKPGNYGGLMVDAFGLVTGYEAGGEGAIVRTIVPRDGIEATESPVGSGVFSVGLEETGVEAGKYRFGRFDVTVNRLGQITRIDEMTPALTPGSFYAQADPNVPSDTPKRITFNADGMITGVTPV